MRIRNNRRGLLQWSILTLLFVSFAVFVVIMNAFVSNNPDHSVWFYLMIIIFILMPFIIGMPYLVLTKKTITIEYEGVAEYKKGRLIKLFKYDEIKLMQISNSTIYIHIQRKGDSKYDNVGLIGMLFKLLVSKEFRKKHAESSITFVNNKRGFEDYELPFLVEIVKRCEFRIAVEHVGDFRSEKRIAMLNKSLKEACKDYIGIKSYD